MNIEHIERLRDYIEIQPAESCNMNYWLCGTTACIGGHCETLLIRDGLISPEPEAMDLDAEFGFRKRDAVVQWLGLTSDEARALFYDYPLLLPESFDWQEWMVERLDEAIALGHVPSRPWERRENILNPGALDASLDLIGDAGPGGETELLDDLGRECADVGVLK